MAEKGWQKGLWALPGTLVFLALAVALACRLSTVSLGLVLPTTGPLAEYGRSLERGARLAEEQVNANGGIQGRRLELVMADSGSDAGVAAKLFQKLVVEDRVPAVVGGASTAECLAMAPIADRYRRVLFSPSASGPEVSRTGPFVFRNWPSDEIEGRTLADFAAYTLHAARALVLVARNPYAEGFQGAFCRRFAGDGRTCDTVPLAPAGLGREWLTGLGKRIDSADVVVLAGYAGDILDLLPGLRLQADLPPLLSVSALAEGDFLKDPALAGVVFARPSYDPDGDREAQLFAAAYAAKYGREPDIYAAHAYDAVRLLALAMVKDGPDAANIQNALLAVRNYPGASGSTTFDSNGDVIQPYQICLVERARAVPLRSVVERVLPELQKRVESRRFKR